MTACFPLLDVAPRQASCGASYSWGRYRHPLFNPDTDRGARPWQLKEWCYQSVSTPALFVAVGLVQLGYVAQLFAYVVDRQSGHKEELELLSPFGRGLSFAASSLHGETVFKAQGAVVRFGYQKGFCVELRLPWSGGEWLLAEWTCVEEDALALLFPLPSNARPAYTHKAAGMRVAGALSIGSRSWSLDTGLGCLDWTRAQAARHTRWKWASCVGRSTAGARVGLNLSAEVYELHGVSQENVLWLDGRAVPLGGVRFICPRKQWGTRTRALRRRPGVWRAKKAQARSSSKCNPSANAGTIATGGFCALASCNPTAVFGGACWAMKSKVSGSWRITTRCGEARSTAAPDQVQLGR